MTARPIIVILAKVGLALALVLIYLWLSRPVPGPTVIVDLGDRIKRHAYDRAIGMRESYRHASGIEVNLSEADGMFTLALARDGKIVHEVTEKFIGRVVVSPGGESVLFVTSNQFDRKTAWVGRQVGVETLHLWHSENGDSVLVEQGFFDGIHVSLDGTQIGIVSQAERVKTGLVMDCATGKILTRIQGWKGYFLLPAGKELALTTAFINGSESELQLLNWRHEKLASQALTVKPVEDITRDPKDPSRVLIHGSDPKSLPESVSIPK